MKHRKLKRDRMSARAGAAQPLPELDAGGGRTELCTPSREAPALRRYVPAMGRDVERELAQLGVLDWRAQQVAGQVDIEQVADRIICADSATALARLPEACITCIITSPPYWNAVDYGFAGQIGMTDYEEYLEQLLEVWAQCERVLEPNGKLCINTPILPIPRKVMPDQHTRHLKHLSNDIEASILRNLGLQRFSLYLWQKQTTEKMFGSYPYPPNIYENNTVEFINVLVKPGRPRRRPPEVKEHSRLTQEQWMNLTRQVWNIYPEDIKRAGHPAPFPEALPNRLIAMYTFAACPAPGPEYPGDIVLDPFCGAGAACVAAKKLGRRFIGIDLGPDFAIEAARRVGGATRDGAVFLCRTDTISSRSA